MLRRLSRIAARGRRRRSRLKRAWRDGDTMRLGGHGLAARGTQVEYRTKRLNPRADRAAAPALWSRRPRVRVPSLTLFLPANHELMSGGRSSAGQTRGKFRAAKPLDEPSGGENHHAVEPNIVCGLRDARGRIPEAARITHRCVRVDAESLTIRVFADDVLGTVPVASTRPVACRIVNGHRFLPSGGHRDSPVVAIGIPRWWPLRFPGALRVQVVLGASRRRASSAI